MSFLMEAKTFEFKTKNMFSQIASKRTQFVNQVEKYVAILLAYILPIENAITERSFVSFLAHFTRQKQFIQKMLKISAPN